MVTNYAYNKLPKILSVLFDPTLSMNDFEINKICGGARFNFWGERLDSFYISKDFIVTYQWKVSQNVTLSVF